MAITQHRVDGRKAAQMAEKVLARLDGERVIEIEVALLLAYCLATGGTKSFSLETRGRRNTIVIERASKLLSETIEAVAAIPDDMLPKPDSGPETTQ